MARGAVLLGAVLLVLGAGACGDEGSSSNTHEPITPECEAIMRACHPVDFGYPGEIHDCHGFAHENHASDCSAHRDECVAACLAASDAGAD